MKPFPLLVLGALVLVGGCKGSAKPLPKTYPVSGKVVTSDGQPVTGGLVQFKPKGDAEFTTTGAIQPDGSFTLSTVVDNQKLTGATEGPHTVTILPPLTQSQQAASGAPPTPVQLPQPYTVKADGENNFTLNVPKGR